MASPLDPPAHRPCPRRSRARERPVGSVGVALLAVLLFLSPGPGSPPPADAAAPASAVDEGSGPGPFVPEWTWPLDPVPEVLRPFEKPPQKWKRGHRGVDLSAGGGTAVQVVSPADGIVSFAGTVVDRGVLSIDHGDGRVSSFEPVTTDLVRGDRAGRGQVVAALRASAGPRPVGGPILGHCPEPCLHWGVRVDGEYVDPLSFVMDRRPSVLLPFGN
ncbi:M23 family metallopeptidase [Arthrobacter sp. TMS1-12-1]